MIQEKKEQDGEGKEGIKLDIQEFISENALIVVPALWVLGMFLKRTPKMPDWLIVWVLLAVGIVFTILLLGTTPDAVLQGILVAGMAVLGHQLLKQTINTDKEDG